MDNGVDLAAGTPAASGTHLVRLDYTYGCAQIINVAARTVIAHYGPGFTRHTLASFLDPDGWELVPHDPADPREGWTYSPSADGREHLIRRRTTMPETATPETVATAEAAEAAAPVADESALPLYLPAPAAPYTVAVDDHRTRPYIAQCTATLGRSATHAGARVIAARHHQETGVDTPEQIPFALNAEEAEPLIRLACRVAVEAQRASDTDDVYHQALRWVAGSGMAAADVHELALTVADEIYDQDR